ncbi:arsenate reductase ArsC [Elusimicrobiota bacterium]
MKKKKVIFICSYNSVRSQIAEGLLKNTYPDNYEVYSAGLMSTGVNPHAIEVMGEIGIDISGQTSNSIDEFAKFKFDYAVTVCSKADKACPSLPAKERIHVDFADPARIMGGRENTIIAFRKLRDDMKKWIKETFKP